jgi:hypothetical protein
MITRILDMIIQWHESNKMPFDLAWEELPESECTFVFEGISTLYKVWRNIEADQTVLITGIWKDMGYVQTEGGDLAYEELILVSFKIS